MRREFLRRFLQHVLPRGFQKVRHYGFAADRSGRLRARPLVGDLHVGPDLRADPRSARRRNATRRRSLSRLRRPVGRHRMLPPPPYLDSS